MNILIIEDEILVAQRLKKLLDELSFEYTFMGLIDSVEESIEFLSTHTPDLIFLDIRLSDGNSFEIFKKIKIKSPIIFTTSYEEFALKAFEINSLAYLLKPIKKEQLEKALAKIEYFKTPDMDILIKNAVEIINDRKKEHYKKRFLVKKGNSMKIIDAQDIVLFNYEKPLIKLYVRDGSSYYIDGPLTNIISILNPLTFFRINRNMIISISYIKEIKPFLNNRLEIIIEQSSFHDEIIVSRPQSSKFKEWTSMG